MPVAKNDRLPTRMLPAVVFAWNVTLRGQPTTIVVDHCPANHRPRDNGRLDTVHDAIDVPDTLT